MWIRASSASFLDKYELVHTQAEDAQGRPEQAEMWKSRPASLIFVPELPGGHNHVWACSHGGWWSAGSLASFQHSSAQSQWRPNSYFGPAWRILGAGSYPAFLANHPLWICSWNSGGLPCRILSCAAKCHQMPQGTSVLTVTLLIKFYIRIVYKLHNRSCVTEK